MSASADADTVRRRLAVLLRLPEAAVAPDRPLADLIVDSLTVVECAIELQDDFDVILRHDDLSRVRTVADLTELVALRSRDDHRGPPR